MTRKSDALLVCSRRVDIMQMTCEGLLDELNLAVDLGDHDLTHLGRHVCHEAECPRQVKLRVVSWAEHWAQLWFSLLAEFPQASFGNVHGRVAGDRQFLPDQLNQFRIIGLQPQFAHGVIQIKEIPRRHLPAGQGGAELFGERLKLRNAAQGQWFEQRAARHRIQQEGPRQTIRHRQQQRFAQANLDLDRVLSA